VDRVLVHVVTVARAGRTVLRVAAFGEVDVASAPLLGQALAAAAEAGSGEVEVDLAGVTFFDCSGLRALERADGAAAGSRLRLIAASEAVRRVLRTFGMQHHFGASRQA
jgi:anti-anti-sigma factor